MRLLGQDGKSFRLSIAGYQYDVPWGEEFDDNWLILDIAFIVGDLTVESVHAPALLVDELVELAGYLEAVADLAVHQSIAIEFLEPLLEIRATRHQPSEVQIDFVLVASKDAEEAPTEFSIVTTSAALAISASELRAELRDFPRR